MYFSEIRCEFECFTLRFQCSWALGIWKICSVCFCVCCLSLSCCVGDGVSFPFGGTTPKTIAALCPVDRGTGFEDFGTRRKDTRNVNVKEIKLALARFPMDFVNLLDFIAFTNCL